MFIKDWQATPLKNTKKIVMVCSRCNNKTKHEVYVEPVGLGVGFIFAKKPIASFKKYHLVCPICGNPTKTITKEELKVLKK